MISPKDSSLIAVIFSQPGISDAELERLYGMFDNPANRRICEAHLGRIPVEDLDVYEQEALREVRLWSSEKTMRMKNEEIAARRQERETRRGSKLMDMYRKGLIQHEVLVLYGISGELPSREAMQSVEERESVKQMFRDRMRSRFGSSWEGRLPVFWISERIGLHDWLKEGF